MEGSLEDKMPISIPDFYNGRSIFITGFTGTLGKILVEKLLYSCPKINKIYALIRHKKGLEPKERLEQIFKSQAFVRLHTEYPGVLESKVIPLVGDVCEKKLGLSHEDEETLKREVSVIFYGAASVRFNDPFNIAVQMNMFGIKEMMEMALEFPKIASIVYISTAYTNCDHLYIKEELYPPKIDWNDMMKISEKIDISTLQTLTRKLNGNLPNTYIFTKGLSEQIINEYKDRLPVSIVRPSIVVISCKEPVSGWVDNKYGPLGIIIATFIGIVRIGHVTQTEHCNYIHSDIVINSIIVASWKRAITQDPTVTQGSEINIYNSCTPNEYSLSHREFVDIYTKGETIKELNKKFKNLVCYVICTNRLWYKINNIIRHVIPAYIIDFILTKTNKKPFLLNIRRQIFIAVEALTFFTTRTFHFEGTKFNNLLKDLRPEDVEVFGWDFSQCDLPKIYDNSYKVVKDSFLKPLHNPKQLKGLYLLYAVDNGVVLLAYLLTFWLIYSFRIPQLLLSFIAGLIFF